MNTPDAGAFAVLNFTLSREDDGRPTQRTASCGTFLEVERAFAVAREEAVRELVRRRAVPQPATSVIELLDTEWGYDVRQDFLVVSRYWVHDRAPMALTT
ncbi:MAG: hypothetical protein ABIZ04_17095 [Opitutus sp.]